MSQVILTEKTLDHINGNKKRKLNLENWKNEVKKTLKNSGLEYIKTNGTLATQIIPPEEDVLNYFNNFNNYTRKV